ncbi:MAG: hypothetical protein V3U92_17255 [Cellulophaga sp.]
MKTIMKFLRYGLLIFAVVFASCSKDGSDGAIGLQGEQGITGQNGSDGTDGTDGTNGNDGANGNANVETTIFINPTWSSSGLMTLNSSNITQDAFDYYLILGYLKEGNVWYSANGNQATGGYYKGYYDVGRYFIRAYDFNDVIDQTRPTIGQAKIVVIKSSNVILTTGNGKSTSTKSNFRKNTLTNLSNAGVDINDYYAVCKYFNINVE